MVTFNGSELLIERMVMVGRKFMTEFSEGGPRVRTDGRLDAPSFHRNHQPVLDVLVPRLVDRAGDALEIGSGSGQHAVQFARALPRLTWWPSDPDPANLESITGWRDASASANLRAPFGLDVLDPDWAFGGPARPPANDLTAIVAINVLHITAWPVTRALLAGAARYLAADGWLFVYGPFKRDGRHTAPSNEAFDRALRLRDPAWGVRDLADVTAVAADVGLARVETIGTPAHNMMLGFRRGATIPE